MRWRGEADCPNVTANATDQEVAIQTFKLPPRSVSVHPGPNNGVVVCWRSPVKGTVRITGGVTRRRPAGRRRHCLGHRSPRMPATAANWRRATSPTAACRVRPGQGCRRADGDVTSNPGDGSICWCCPRRDYTCDTTTVDLTDRAARRLAVVEPGRRRGRPTCCRTARAIRTPTAAATPACGLSGTWPTAEGRQQGVNPALGRRGSSAAAGIDRAAVEAGGPEFPEGVHADRRRQPVPDQERRGREGAARRDARRAGAVGRRAGRAEEGGRRP